MCDVRRANSLHRAGAPQGARSRLLALLMALAMTPAVTAAQGNAPAGSAPVTTPAAAPTAGPTSALPAALSPFEASYSWYWRGMRVAVSTMSLQHRDDDIWVYSSSTSPRGIGRLYPMRPKLLSVMRLLPHGLVEPLNFSATGSGADHDASVMFDWTADRAIGVYEGTRVDLPISPGVQDDLSVQIAMLAQLLQGRTPDMAMELNHNAVRKYEYTRDGSARLDTSLGAVQTIIYLAQHPGSPRITRFWCAPSLGYVPMQVQQTRLKSVEWTLKIRTLKRGADEHPPPPAP